MVTRKAGVWYPFNHLREQLNREFGGLVNTLAESSAKLGSVGAYPALNVWEEGDTLYAEAELPGLKHEAVEISVAGKELTIRGHRGEQAAEGAAYHRRERGVGDFMRMLRLPYEIDSTRVEATLKDGVLLVTLPKHEAAKARKIQLTPKS